MINVNSLKSGITFKQNKDVYSVLDASHSKQGRGQASVKVKVKNLRTGSITVLSYTGGDKVESAHISKREMDFLYKDTSNIILMDKETFNQVEISIKNIKWELNFLKEGNKVIVKSFNSEILGVELPINIELKVVTAPDAIKGNTQSNPQKKVILETGFELEVPMFIKEEEVIIVSSETGKYVGKGK